MRIRTVAPVVALATLLITVPATAAQTNVTIANSAFNSATVTVALGDSVLWDNTDGFSHTSSGVGPLKLWNLGIPSGDDRARTFVQAGTFAYVCNIHGFMSGTVKVPLKATPSSGSAGTTFTIRVATNAAPSGFRYVIQRRRPGGSFRAWRDTTAKTVTFKSSVTGTWRFRAKLKRTSNGSTSAFSPVVRVAIS